MNSHSLKSASPLLHCLHLPSASAANQPFWQGLLLAQVPQVLEDRASDVRDGDLPKEKCLSLGQGQLLLVEKY